VIKEASGFTLFKGDKNIIAHFEAQKKNEAVAPETTVVPAQSSTLDFSSDFLGTGQDNECAITVTEPSSCEGHNTTPLPQQ